MISPSLFQTFFLIASINLFFKVTVASLEPEWVHFESDGISIAGHLYVPRANFTAARQPAIVIGHPRGGVKEQTAGKYARELAEQSGFITLAFDAAYQGESGGLPRYIEDPYQRANDIRNAVSYLSTLDFVDPNNIGALGICASGGYVPFAAQTDKRIKAVATVSAVDMGTLNAEGFGSYGGPILPTLNGLLEEAGRQRTAEALGSAPNQTRIVPHTAADVTPNLPIFYQEAHSYYRTPRGQRPTSPNLNLWRSIDLLATYRSYSFIQLISPRPLLMVVGGDADTQYFSEHAIRQAEEPKELFVIPGLTHIDLYDHTNQSVPKLVNFFTENLRSLNSSVEQIK